MKIFKEINKSGKCLICKTNKTGKVCLIKIVGTERADGIMEAKQVHIDCLDLSYIKGRMIFQKVEEK